MNSLPSVQKQFNSHQNSIVCFFKHHLFDGLSLNVGGSGHILLRGQFFWSWLNNGTGRPGKSVIGEVVDEGLTLGVVNLLDVLLDKGPISLSVVDRLGSGISCIGFVSGEEGGVEGGARGW